MNKRIILYLIIFIIPITVLYSVGYHIAEEIGSGTFNGNFIFNGNVDFQDANINGIQGEDFPVGAILPFPNANIPINWSVCNGSNLSRTIYLDLYNIIGTTYGVGDGSTTFNLPDLRGEFVRGFDNGRGIDSGRVLGSFQNDQFQDHGHSLSGGTPVKYRYANDIVWSNNDRRWYLGGTSITILDPNSGNYGAETRPRNIAMKYIIKVK